MKPISIPAAVSFLLIVWLGSMTDVWASRCFDSHSTDKKVVFGTPLRSDDLDQDVTALREELVFAFEIERERYWVEHPEEPIAFVTCDSSGIMTRPELRRLADERYHQGVVLEVRSLLQAMTSGNGAGKEAILQYISVPVALLGQEAALGGGLYGRRIAIADNGDFLEAFVRPRDIDAYIATGLGLRYADERAYDLAWSNLCEAQRHLGEIAARPAEHLSSPQRAAVKELQRFVEDRLTKTVVQGRNQSGSHIAYLFEARGDGFLDNPCLTGGSADDRG